MSRSPTASLAPVVALAHRLGGLLSAVAFVFLAAGVRIWLGGLLPGLSVFSLYYPAILGAALIGGESAAALALALSVASSWFMLHNARGLIVPMGSIALNLVIFVLSAAFIGAVGAQLRRLLRRRRVDILRLGEREARYRALFEGVSEGFALVEGVWSDQGRLLDFAMVETNPAFLKMFHLPPSLIGRKQSEHPSQLTPDYLAACERAFAGPPVRLELFDPNYRRWYDIHMSRVGETKLAQIYVDVTDRKAAEGRQAEMFDELNHRVKNNLASISAMLSMQARAADEPRVREQLQKAVDRIEAIADVHASLYRAGSTDEVDFGAYLQRLCERLSAGLVDSERVRIDVDADPTMAPLEEAVALGLIVNELVTNAAKYAYPAPAAGVIRVALRNQPGELMLNVSDHGQGLAENGNGAGIGMRLVRSLVQQCHGELEMAQNGGASFTVRLREHGRPVADNTQSRLL